MYTVVQTDVIIAQTVYLFMYNMLLYKLMVLLEGKANCTHYLLIFLFFLYIYKMYLQYIIVQFYFSYSVHIFYFLNVFVQNIILQTYDTIEK